MTAPTDDTLVHALTEAARATFTALREAHPGSRFYAMGLYVTRDLLFIGPTAASEEGLQAKAADKDASAVRWSLPDSPHHLFEEERFEPVQELLAARPDPYELDEDEFAIEVATRRESCFAALAKLDAEGVFGTGAEREALCVNVFASDESDRVRLENAQRLNPERVLQSMAPEMKVREPTGDPMLIGSTATYQIAGLAYDDGLLVAAGTSGELFGWRLGDGEPEPLFAFHDEDEHWAVALDEGGVLYGSTGGIRRRALDLLDEPTVVLDREAKVTQLVRSPDGSTIIADEAFEHLVAIDAEGAILWERTPGGRPLAYAPDGSALAAAGNGGECVGLVDPGTGEDRAIVACRGTTAAAFGPEAATLAVANRAGVQLHAKVEGWSAVHHWPEETTANALAFSPSGARLAAAFDDGTLRVWDVESRTRLLDVHGRQEALLAVVWLDDDRVAAGGRDVDHGPPVYVWRIG